MNKSTFIETRISPLAVVSSEAQIGERVQIGDFTRILGKTVIGDESIIDSHCILGQYPFQPDDTAALVIGKRAFIRSHSVFYAGSIFSDEMVTGHRVVVRGGIEAGRCLQIGSDTHLEGDSSYGDCVRTNTRVLLGRKTSVGSFVHIAPNVSTFNDPFPPSSVHCGVTISDLAVIGGSSTLYPGIKIGFGALVAANSVVRSDVADATCVQGSPAKVFCNLKNLINLEHALRSPWPSHFRRGYPSDLMLRLDDLQQRLENKMKEV